MGFILEKYSENAAGLVVSFQQTADSDVFCAADSVEAAMEHFGLYKDESGNLKLKDANEEAMGDLGIKPDEAEELRSTLDERCRPRCPRCGGRFPKSSTRNGYSLWGRMMRMAKATP